MLTSENKRDQNEITVPLTPDEKAHLKALIDADAPLPPAYRDRIFAEPSGVELAWPGKHSAAIDAATVAPELHVAERYGTNDGWQDKLILGDNTPVLRALSRGPLRDEIAASGGLRLIYLDPPFLTGRRFAAEVQIGETPPGRPATTIRLPAYHDAKTGGLAAYLDAMLVRLRLMHRLLADDGSLYFHCDHRLSAAMRLLLDEVFGPDRLVNEIVWHYGLGNPGGRRAFARKHDTILLYAKTDRYRFNRLRGEITPAMAGKYRHEDESGRYLRSYGKKYYLQGGKPLDTVWTIPTLGATDSERLGYPTQKPEALLERILLASSDPGDLVADFCCGAGTLPAVAARLGRRWLACDASPRAIQTTRTRLLGSGVHGFDLMEIVGGARPGLPLDDAVTLAAAASSGPDGITVRITGYAPVTGPPSPAPQGSQKASRDSRGGAGDGRMPSIRPDVTESWSDWIESWTVAVTAEPDEVAAGPLYPVWWTARTGRSRTLALVSPPLPFAGQPPRRVTVQAVDVLGRESRVSIRLAAASSSDGVAGRGG